MMISKGKSKKKIRDVAAPVSNEFHLKSPGTEPESPWSDSVD
jgi:hypothetical protein